MPAIGRTDYERRVFLAMNYISENIERELSLEEIAASAAFSPFHFHHIFKAVAGENVAEFTRRLRLELAAGRLAAHPREAVTSISLSSGFSSSQNLAKAFRLRYGMSPSEYRSEAARGAMPPSPEAARDVSIREMPASRAATIRRIGAYAETCPAAFAELLEWARGMPPQGPVFFQEIGGGQWAFCRFEVKGEEIGDAWRRAFRWLVESGLECRPTPCCEIYHNDARFRPEGKWIIDIAIPLRSE